MSDMKRLTAKEFRELGLLQEVNRLCLHPAGLALETVVETSTGEERFGGVWDCRDDPEGIRFTTPPALSMEGALLYLELVRSKFPTRCQLLGGHAQGVREPLGIYHSELEAREKDVGCCALCGSPEHQERVASVIADAVLRQISPENRDWMQAAREAVLEVIRRGAR